MDAWVGKYFSIFHVARAGKWISNVVIFDKLLPLMCALRVELVRVYVFFLLNMLEIVDFLGGACWFTHLS